MKKFKLTTEKRKIKHPLTSVDVTLYRIKALKGFSDVKKGDIGGWVEKEANLSHDGICWLYDDACNFESSFRSEDSIGRENSLSFGNSQQYGNSHQSGYSHQLGYSKQFGYSHQLGYSRQFGDSQQSGNSRQFVGKFSTGIQQSNADFAVLELPVWMCTITRESVRIGCQIHTASEWKNFTDKEIADMDSDALSWWKMWKKTILSAAKTIQEEN